LDRGGHAPSITPPCSPNVRPGRRLQRPRTKGHKTPEGVFYAGRPSHLFNPFEHRQTARGTRRFRHARSVELHRRWLTRTLGVREMRRLGFSNAEIAKLWSLRAKVFVMLPALRGHDIECWCPATSRWCHADTILELANAPETLQ
jgi:hypothetical protein